MRLCFSGCDALPSGIRELEIELYTVGRTCNAIERSGLLEGYGGLVRYPYGRDGGLMKLVARVTQNPDGTPLFDGAIYLIDPVDPSSSLPGGAGA